MTPLRTRCAAGVCREGLRSGKMWQRVLGGAREEAAISRELPNSSMVRIPDYPGGHDVIAACGDLIECLHDPLKSSSDVYIGPASEAGEPFGREIEGLPIHVTETLATSFADLKVANLTAKTAATICWAIRGIVRLVQVMDANFLRRTPRAVVA